jgi:hypothetical protein
MKVKKIDCVYSTFSISFYRDEKFENFLNDNNIKYVKSLNDEYIVLEDFKFLKQYGAELIVMNLLHFYDDYLLNYSYDRIIDNKKKNNLIRKITNGKNKNNCVLKILNKDTLNNVLDLKEYENVEINNDYYLATNDLVKDLLENICNKK